MGGAFKKVNFHCQLSMDGRPRRRHIHTLVWTYSTPDCTRIQGCGSCLEPTLTPPALKLFHLLGAIFFQFLATFFPAGQIRQPSTETKVFQTVCRAVSQGAAQQSAALEKLEGTGELWSIREPEGRIVKITPPDIQLRGGSPLWCVDTDF